MLENVINVGVVLFTLCWVFWALNIYSNFRNDQKANSERLGN